MTLPDRPLQPGGGGFIANLPLYVKLIGAFVVVTALSVAAIVYFSTTSTSQSLISNIGTNLQLRGQAQAKVIASIIEDQAVNPLQTLALNKLLQDSAGQASSSYRGTADEIKTLITTLDKQWATVPDSDLLVQRRITGDLSGELQEYASTFPANVEVFITDSYGGLVAASKRTSDFYQADEDWWQQAWNNDQGKVYVSQPLEDESTKTLSLQIAIPMYAHNPTGEEKVVGVVRTTYKLDAIAQAVYDFKLGTTGRAELFLGDKRVLTLQDKGVVPVSASTTAALDAVGDTPYSDLVYEGDRSLVSQIPLSSVSNKPYVTALGWKLVVHQDLDEILQPVTDITRSTLIAGLIVIGVAAIIALLISRLIVGPIQRLTQAARQIATGNFSQRVSIGSRDEIGTLATNMNTMADQLQELVGTLEARIASRTRDLQIAVDVNAQISTILQVDRLLQDVVDLTKERFGLYHAHIYLVDQSGDNLILESGAGHVGRQMVAQKRAIALNNTQSIVANAARTRRGVIINNVRQSATFLSNPLLPDTRSELAVPLVARGQLLGVLDVQSDEVDYFTPEVLAVMELMAGQIATALSNARLYEVSERTSRHERALGNIDRRIQTATSVDEILQVTARELGKALRVPYSAIELQLPQNGSPTDTDQPKSESEPV